MSQYSYSNTINIVTNVSMLEFFSARFVDPSALVPFYCFLM